MRSVATIALFGVLLPGCIFGADADDDGLKNGEEEDMGLDPNNADSDNDGWNDGDEVDAGSDPLVADTDGDGLLDGRENEIGTDFDNVDTDGDSYSDRDEDFEGTDPLDDADVIYEGGWPYYFEKTELSGGNVFEENKRFANFEFRDQYGDMVSLWDFHNDENKYIVLDFSAEWCYWCHVLAEWLEYDNEQYAGFEAVRDAVKGKDIYWITIINGDNYGAPPTADSVDNWYTAYPNKKIPVLEDSGQESSAFINQTFWPNLVLLNPDLKVDTESAPSYDAVLGAAADILAAAGNNDTSAE